MKNFKDYARGPILLNSHTVALIKIYDRYSHVDDMWTSELDFIDRMVQEDPDHKKAAQQFILQFEGKVSINFLKSLKIEIDNYIEEFHKRFDNEK